MPEHNLQPTLTLNPSPKLCILWPMGSWYGHNNNINFKSYLNHIFYPWLGSSFIIWFLTISPRLCVTFTCPTILVTCLTFPLSPLTRPRPCPLPVTISTPWPLPSSVFTSRSGSSPLFSTSRTHRRASSVFISPHNVTFWFYILFQLTILWIHF